jgi:hypothetical protein
MARIETKLAEQNSDDCNGHASRFSREEAANLCPGARPKAANAIAEIDATQTSAWRASVRMNRDFVDREECDDGRNEEHWEQTPQ